MGDAGGGYFDGKAALADVDRDGDLELIAGGRWGGQPALFALQEDGTEVPGWPQILDQGYEPQGISSIAVGDLDFDGHVEIVAVTLDFDYSVNDFIPSPVYVYEDTGELRPGWPAFPDTPGGYMDYPRIADLDGDGACEIIGTQGLSVAILDDEGQTIQTIYGPSGPRRVGIGDVDGDGSIDIVAGNFNYIYVWSVTEGLLAGLDVPTATSGIIRSFSLADVDGDGASEIGYYVRDGSVNRVYLTDGTLTPLPGFPFENDDATSGFAASYQTHFLDFDGDGDMEFAFSAGAMVHVLDIPNPTGNPITVEWSGIKGKPTGSAYYHEGKERFMVRGDSNLDGHVGLIDAVLTLQHLFLGNPLSCEQAADANADDVLTISDAIRTIHLLFEPGSPPLPHPYPGCGRVLDGLSLSCEASLPGSSCP